MKTRTFLFMLIAATCLTACQKDDDNGSLYGQWLLTSRTMKGGAQWATTSNDTRGEAIFWSFQLNLMKLSTTRSQVPALRSGILARFSHKNDSLYVNEMYHNARFNDELIPDSVVATIGIAGLTHTHTAFKIEHLSDERMTLSNSDVRLTFKKY